MKLQIESVIRSLWTLLRVPSSVVIPLSPDSPCRFHFTAYHKIDLAAAVFRVRFERSGRTGSGGRKGANQPREEFLLFIASILGAAARETENSNGDGRRGRGRRDPIPKAATDLQSIYRTKLFTRRRRRCSPFFSSRGYGQPDFLFGGG